MTNTLEQLAADLVSGRVRVIDLTQPLSPDTPVIQLPPEFAPSPGLSLDEISCYDEGGPAWYWNTLHLGEHTGTHFDAPIHWITGKDLPENATHSIPAEQFVRPACVFDVRDRVADDADFVLMPSDVEAWEERHGRLPKGSWLLLCSGWSTRRDATSFINADDQGPHSPGFHPDTSRMLAEDRDIVGVGVETIGTDAGQAGGFDPPFPSHTLMHGAGELGLASLCNLDLLPPTGAILIAAPLKIVDGSGSPLRVLALVTNES